MTQQPPADPGTDVEDELSIPASPLADVSHAVVSLSVQADVDSELEWVFVDVGSLPKMVTPVGNPDGALTRALHTTPAGCSVSVAPDVSECVVQPSMASSPAGPDVGSPGFPHPSTGSVGLPFVNRSSLAGPALEEFLLPQAADVNLTQPEAGFVFTGGLFPAVPLTPVRPPAAASRHSGESDAVVIKMVRAPLSRRSYYRTTRGVSFE